MYLTPPSQASFAAPPVEPVELIPLSHVQPTPACNAAELPKPASVMRLAATSVMVPTPISASSSGGITPVRLNEGTTDVDVKRFDAHQIKSGSVLLVPVVGLTLPPINPEISDPILGRLCVNWVSLVMPSSMEVMVLPVMVPMTDSRLPLMFPSHVSMLPEPVKTLEKKLMISDSTVHTVEPSESTSVFKVSMAVLKILSHAPRPVIPEKNATTSLMAVQIVEPKVPNSDASVVIALLRTVHTVEPSDPNRVENVSTTLLKIATQLEKFVMPSSPLMRVLNVSSHVDRFGIPEKNVSMVCSTALMPPVMMFSAQAVKF